MAVYVLVLKRNGWIGRSAVEESPAEKPIIPIKEKPIVKIQQPVPLPSLKLKTRLLPAPKIEKKEPEIRATVPTAPPLIC